MSHEGEDGMRVLAEQLRDLAVLVASIGDVVDDLTPDVIDLTDLRRAHREHVRPFADAVFRAVRDVRSAADHRGR